MAVAREGRPVKKQRTKKNSWSAGDAMARPQKRRNMAKKGGEGMVGEGEWGPGVFAYGSRQEAEEIAG